jgi:hypothetical protein
MGAQPTGNNNGADPGWIWPAYLRIKPNLISARISAEWDRLATFRVWTSLRALENEECLFSRTWTFDIPRDGG